MVAALRRHGRLGLAGIGAALVAAGLWMIYPPAALLAVGAASVWVAYRLELTQGHPPPDGG